MARETVIVGHSFVRRLGDYIHQRDHKNFNVNPLLVRVRVRGIGGLSIQKLYCSFDDYLREIVGTGDKTVSVILSIGGNDLARGRDSLSVAHDIVLYAEHLHSVIGINHVFVTQLLPRFSIDQPVFCQDPLTEVSYGVNLRRANHYLQVMLDHPFSHYRMFKKLRVTPRRYFYDGVHLHNGMVKGRHDPEQDGMIRYYREMRGVVLKSLYV